MDKRFLFERNLLALSRFGGDLCRRLSAAETTLGRYRFVESRGGDALPAWVDAAGTARTLHSLTAPEKEAERLIGTIGGEGFVVFLGLGGGYYVEAALARADIARILVIDFDINGIAELLCHRDYIRIFNDERVIFLADPGEETLKRTLLDNYQPALHGGLKTIPLRPRAGFDAARFGAASAAIKKALELIAEDYSVQSCFGRRWFSNIIHNTLLSETRHGILPPVSHAAVCAAGPSLDAQMDAILKTRAGFFLIATDTSLPALLGAGVKPDAVVSIDCQHISCYHFFGAALGDTPLFLDLASPPLIAERSRNAFFFSGGHPLTNYVCARYRGFPVLDTSGANVTYAAVSLAETLGARRLTLFGADFSYPGGAVYCRGAYFYPFFARRQSRLRPAETLVSDFLYRIPSLRRVERDGGWYYETRSLALYRRRLEEKSAALTLGLRPVPGGGAPLALSPPSPPSGVARVFASGRARMGARAFLESYRQKIEALPPLRGGIVAYAGRLDAEERQVFTTLLPALAAERYRGGGLAGAPAREDAALAGLLARTREYCALKIERLLKV